MKKEYEIVIEIMNACAGSGRPEVYMEEAELENPDDFVKMKQWYDGYGFRDVGSVYNPNSVMKAIRNDDFDSYDGPLF